jgi:hypothetical protein
VGEGGTLLPRVRGARPLLRVRGRNALLWWDGEGTKALPAGSRAQSPWAGGIVNGGWKNPLDQGERASANGSGGATATHLAKRIATHFLPAEPELFFTLFTNPRFPIITAILLPAQQLTVARHWLINLYAIIRKLRMWLYERAYRYR